MAKITDIARGYYVKSPRWVKVSAGPLLSLMPVSMRYGGSYKHWQGLIERSERDPEWVRQYQLRNLREIVDAAARSSSFYQKWIAEAMGGIPSAGSFTFDDLQKLPLLTKDRILDLHDQLLVTDAADVDLVETSGTSGKPFRCYLDKDRGVREFAFLNHFWKRTGYREGDVRCVLRGTHIRKVDTTPWEWDPALRELKLSPFRLTTEVMDLYLELIDRYKVSCIHGYPSAITIIARHAINRNWQPKRPIVGILPISEHLRDNQRSTIENAFNGVNFAPCYGMSEKVAFAAEVPGRTDVYDFEPLYGYAELVDAKGQQILEPGRRGRIVGTGFISKAMPLLRYDSEDDATLVELPSAKNAYRLRVENISSRWGQDFLVGREGNLISSTAIIMNYPAYGFIREYQFFQDTMGEVTVKVVPIEGATANDLSALVEDIQENVGSSLGVNIEIVSSIAMNSRGKRPWVVQRLEISAP